MKSKFYVTTAIDYTDDVIHIGHAYQKIVADVYARYHRLIGDKTFFLTGTDEHGQKSEKPAKEKGISPKEFVDEISKKDKEQLDSLNISYNRFIRTTDLDHIEIVKKFWRKLEESGDIYLGGYTGLYCPGCEGFKTEKDLVNGKCPYHPKGKIVTVTEENYFFRWSKYEDFLREHIKSHPKFVLPEVRANEMLAFLDEGLKDIPFSRPTVRWGIPVPGDPTHFVYVWPDALCNYLTAGLQNGFWEEGVEIVHFLGKDNTRWHALLWPAMLKSAGYRLPTTVYAHGFLSLEGKKISKSLGNIIRPTELVEKFGVDGTRHYLLATKNLADDGDVSLSRMKEVYNADLAHGLGNLVARVAKLCQTSGFDFEETPSSGRFDEKVKFALSEYRLNDALSNIWLDAKMGIYAVDKMFQEKKPWNLSGRKLHRNLLDAVSMVRHIAYNLQPFLPEAAEKIKAQFKGPKIKAEKSLFPRI